MSSPLDEPKYNSQRALDEKDFVLMYLKKATTWIEKDEPILALSDIGSAVNHTKQMWKNKEKALEQMQKNDTLPLPEGIEIV